MSPTLYDKIREAVFREPRLTPQQVQDAKAAEIKEAILSAVQASKNGLGESVEGEGASQAQSSGIGNAEGLSGERQERPDSPVARVVETPQVVQAAVLEEAAPRQQAHSAHRYGGGLNVARAGSQDGERINSLTATVTAIQAVVAKDQQQANDLAHFARLANDAIRVHSGLVK